MAEFILLGTGAGPGVPSFFCNCPGCQEAREQPEYARTRSGAALVTEKGTLLIDASPDLRQQLVREKIRGVNAVFLTHWHYDHFAGLGELEYYVKLKRGERIPLYLPPTALDLFRNAFAELMDVFDPVVWEFFRGDEFGGIMLTPLPAKHSIETAGVLLESPKIRIAYFPDTAAGLDDLVVEKISGVDLFICDATFYGENWYPDAHMSVDEAIQLGKTIKAKTTILTHLSVHYSQPFTSRELKKLKLEDCPSIDLAYDGMKIRV